MKRVIELADPCGFCSGVREALKLIEKTLENHPGSAQIYVLRGLIHNNGVTQSLKERGCNFAENTEEIPDHAVVVLGAHGVSAEIERIVHSRPLTVVDATCPLVRALQQSAARVAPEQELVLFGHRGHPEVEGVLGHAGTKKIFVIESPEAVAELPELIAPVLLVQTTLSHIEAEKVKQALLGRFPNLQCGHGICNASLLRQQAVERLARKSDLVVVVGSSHSSNANRLREAAESAGCRAVLIDTPAEITAELLRDCVHIGISAAASTPEFQIQAVIDRINTLGE